MCPEHPESRNLGWEQGKLVPDGGQQVAGAAITC